MSELRDTYLFKRLFFKGSLSLLRLFYGQLSFYNAVFRDSYLVYNDVLRDSYPFWEADLKDDYLHKRLFKGISVLSKGWRASQRQP